MKFSLWSVSTCLLLATSLLVHGLVRAQDSGVQQQTRPRRVTDPTQEATVPETSEPVVTTLASLAGEPTIRIGLATSARSVTVSTSTATLLQSTEPNGAPAPLQVARVRIEPRSYAPFPPTNDSADSIAENITDEPSTDADSTLLENSRSAQAEPASRANRDRTSGAERMPGSTQNPSQNPNQNPAQNPNQYPNQYPGAARRAGAGSVRLTSRVVAPVRGALVYASSTTPILEARAPITFASTDEAQSPVRFNEKAYRGRLEVFANARGTLTVVNVLGLEEYVRGVVPNELSPGAYPSIEALKAQAVAARTYAVSHRGQFVSEGFDLLPTTRSQVYGGRQTEHPLTDRAVEETRGRVATYRGEVINALYTSTCGGRTEDGEAIFGGEPTPYLRGRECAVEGREPFAPYIIRTTREPLTLRDGEHLSSARDAALLFAHSIALPAARINDEWLDAPVTLEEVRTLLSGVAMLARQSPPTLTSDATRPPAFSSALAQAAFGESRGDVLLNSADLSYLLAFRDADDIPAANRADVAMLLREGHLALYADATLRPRLALTRARALHTVAHLLEARGLFRLQKATARPAASGSLVVRPSEGRGAERTLPLSPDAYLFRAFGESLFPVREVAIVGGEPVLFHTGASGAVDYLEVRPAPNGAAADHSSPYANWTVTLSLAEVANRLARWAGRVGTIVDLRVVGRGSSRRALDLEVRGTQATAHVRGGRIRSALGLREQLFVVERRYDEAGRLEGFIFTGRGWGHGVGMCQVGAYGLARAGWSYDKILKAYYSGIALVKLY